MGTTVVGLASQAFGSINIGVSAIVFLFLAGALFFMKTVHSGSAKRNRDSLSSDRWLIWAQIIHPQSIWYDSPGAVW